MRVLHVMESTIGGTRRHIIEVARGQNALGVDVHLALVVGLQGRFEEAEQIASQELSPEQAQANVTYLRSMLSQQNAWSQLKAQDGEKPTTN